MRKMRGIFAFGLLGQRQLSLQEFAEEFNLDHNIRVLADPANSSRIYVLARDNIGARFSEFQDVNRAMKS